MGIMGAISWPLSFEPAEIQLAGLLRSLLISIGVWLSKNTSLRFGIISPNWIVWFERWIGYGVTLIFMSLLGLLGWTTWNAIRSHAHT
jgi:hypothetical protein